MTCNQNWGWRPKLWTGNRRGRRERQRYGVRIKDLEIHLLSDGLVQVDAGGPFGLVPRVLYEPHFRPNESNLVAQCLTCLLVKSEGRTILIDTGLGPKLTPKEVDRWNLDRPGGDLVDGLGRLDLEPADIDLVIDTHLHWDHCGGNTDRQGGEIVARYPNAEYVVQRLEWSEASHPDARTRGTYFPDNFQPLVAAKQMRLLVGDEQITKHVRCVVTPGHTRGHQSVLLQAGDWRGLFVADMASYAVHMAKSAWLTAYDVLPLENIRTKRRWQRWALECDAWLFFQHDPSTPVGRLVQEEGRLRIAELEEAAELIAALPTP